MTTPSVFLALFYYVDINISPILLSVSAYVCVSLNEVLNLILSQDYDSYLTYRCSVNLNCTDKY